MCALVVFARPSCSDPVPRPPNSHRRLIRYIAPPSVRLDATLSFTVSDTALSRKVSVGEKRNEHIIYLLFRLPSVPFSLSFCVTHEGIRKSTFRVRAQLAGGLVSALAASRVSFIAVSQERRKSQILKQARVRIVSNVNNNNTRENCNSAAPGKRPRRHSRRPILFPTRRFSLLDSFVHDNFAFYATNERQTVKYKINNEK